MKGSHPRVLVVDDSQTSLMATRAVLEDAGFVVKTLSSPFGFASALGEAGPDLVLVDVSMPGLAGDKLVQIARRHAEDHEPPSGARGQLRAPKLLLYSDRSDAELAALAEACGADGSVSKSVDDGALVETLRRHLGERAVGAGEGG